MATVSGQRGTGNILSSLRKPDIASMVAELEPESAPLTVLTNRLEKAPCVNAEFNWFEDDLEPRWDQIDEGSGFTSGDTVLTVDNGAFFAEHYLVWVPRTSEMLRVTGVNGNAITVVRGVGSTPAALVDDDPILVVGTAMMEGDTSRPARSSNPTKKTNYTQITRTPFESTGTLMASQEWVVPSDWDRQAKHGGIEHAKDLEYIAWFGKPSENTSGAHPRRTSGGFFHFVTTNAQDAQGAYTEAEFLTALRTNTRYGRNLFGFAGRLPVDVLNGFPRGKLEVTQNETTYGIAVMKYISPHGTVSIITHDLFEESYAGHIAFLNPRHVRKRYLANGRENRDTHSRPNIQPNDQDGRKDELLTECGLEFKQDLAHGFTFGITG